MSMVRQLALRSVHKVTELWQQIKIFIKTVLHVLVMCGHQTYSSSVITPRCRCSWASSVGLSLRLRLKWSGRSWCFCLVVSRRLLVFAGCKIMALLSHQSDASFMFLCISFWTVSVSLSDVLVFWTVSVSLSDVLVFWTVSVSLSDVLVFWTVYLYQMY